MHGELSVSLKHFTINLTLLDGIPGDVDEVEVRRALIDGLRRGGVCGATGFEVTVSEPSLTGPDEPATHEHSAPEQAAFDAIADAWSIAAKAVVNARAAERDGQTGPPPNRGASAPGRA
jgi:hypothetical protein